MMLLPSNQIFPRSFDFFENSFFDNERNMLKADISVMDDNYQIEVDIPGIEKENINLTYENGYLTITASRDEIRNESLEYVRKERYYGNYKRSFYVGTINENNIKAEYHNGILKITVPKEEENQNTVKQISID